LAAGKTCEKAPELANMLLETEVVAAEAESALPWLSGSSNPDLLRQVI